MSWAMLLTCGLMIAIIKAMRKLLDKHFFPLLLLPYGPVIITTKSEHSVCVLHLRLVVGEWTRNYFIN